MYIPREQAFLQRPAPPIAFPSYDPLSRDTETAFYYYSSRVVGTNGTADPENDARAIIVSAAFISVTVTCLSIFALLFGVALYRRCTGRDDQSDTSSATSESAWHIDGTDVVADDDVAKRHRQRLKKLDQVAPRKSLHDWRAEKTTSHVQTTAICLDLIDEKEQVRELQCGHVYHASCLNLWVERGHHDCPLCKFDILGLKKKPAKAQDADLERGEAAEPEPEHDEHDHRHAPVSNTQDEAAPLLGPEHARAQR